MTQEIETEEYRELLKYFIDEFPIDLIVGNLLPKTKLEELAVEFLNRVTDIHTVFERLNNYPVYFQKFYTQHKEIPETEAIEYHIDSYLNDFYSLKEKIIRLLGYIKNNLREFNVANPRDVEKLLKHLKDQTEKGLRSIVLVRGENVHNYSIRDPEISKAKIILQAINLSVGSWNAQHKALAEKKYFEIIEASKEKYINQSKNNQKELNKLKNFFAPRLGHIIASLYEHNADRFKKMIEK